MSEPPKRTTSGIQVDSSPNNYGVTGTVTLSRKSMGLGSRKEKAPPPPEKKAAPPAAEVAKMPYSVATKDGVGCPSCNEQFEISPDFYNTVTECPSCKKVFVIRPPGTPAPDKASGGGAAAAASEAEDNKTTASGIQVDSGAHEYGVTGTVLLSREGMGMMQRKRGTRRPQREQRSQRTRPGASGAAAAPAAEPEKPYSVATESDVGCPKCNERFEISPDFYGMEAECPECSIEFVIKPPGTPPYKPGTAAPAHAPAQVAADPVANADEAAPVEEAADETPAAGGNKNLPIIIGAAAVIVVLLAVIVLLLAKK